MSAARRPHQLSATRRSSCRCGSLGACSRLTGRPPCSRRSAGSGSRRSGSRSRRRRRSRSGERSVPAPTAPASRDSGRCSPGRTTSPSSCRRRCRCLLRSLRRWTTRWRSRYRRRPPTEQRVLSRRSRPRKTRRTRRPRRRTRCWPSCAWRRRSGRRRPRSPWSRSRRRRRKRGRRRRTAIGRHGSASRRKPALRSTWRSTSRLPCRCLGSETAALASRSWSSRA
mmetsp:Transcript_113785/g.317814  ORF Transcript_113785/g.317814 Transcript_113785/m.317814 type:complete len:225 (+) Transcript_113785:236-910(+)